MIDKTWIGKELVPSVLHIERSRLKQFAKATGETDPVYTDPAAARASGHADIPAPPTFLFSVELDSGATFRMLADMGVPLDKLLHGEQHFVYHQVACAGDTVTVRSTIEDIHDKKGGALEFIVKASRAFNQRDELVAEMRSVLICRR